MACSCNSDSYSSIGASPVAMAQGYGMEDSYDIPSMNSSMGSNYNFSNRPVGYESNVL